MQRGRTQRAWRVALPLAAALCACQGCATIKRFAVFTYDRVNDTGDMVDLGITVSKKRCLSVYACGFGLATLGGGYFDGYYAGLGGGRLGIMRHYHKTVGLLVYSFEEYAWGKFDLNDPKTLNRRHVGPIGFLFFPRPKSCGGPS